MPMTRAKATSLLNQKEMSLYDDSRVNTLRQLDAKALTTRITRARASRDRARDLVQRQKLASRDRTGNKRGTSGVANQRSKDKAELMADILKRFEDQLKQAERAERKAAKTASKGAVKDKATVTKSAAPAARRKTSSQTRASARLATRDAAAGSAASRKTVRKATKKKTASGASTDAGVRATGKASKAAGATTKAAKKAEKTTAGKTARKAAKQGGAKPAAGETGKAAKRTAKRLTPEQALERTRKLLEDKQARDREPKAWEAAGQGEAAEGRPGFQSGAAARRAEQLHAGETRLPAIQGSISTRDRINQGKRDHRRAPGGED